jgi:hypothetical protein
MVVDQFHGNQLELAAMHELGCWGVTDRATKSQVIPEGPILQASRAKDHYGLRLDDQPRAGQRRALDCQSITEFTRLGHDPGKSTDADPKTLNAGGSWLTLRKCFKANLHQTVGDGQFVHLEWARTRQYTYAEPATCSHDGNSVRALRG